MASNFQWKLPMRIAIDYDGTYTADPPLWDDFIHKAKAAGHSVWIITCRRGTEEERHDIQVEGAYTIFTNLMAKRLFCESRQLKIDIWIDDDPACILHGK
jgi:hypothetical protein